ncbi:MAG: four-helix bundle copper-binding protein [Euryarchaeota archaeon]|nr:four-helix bundle copper-binding protein [Euryarchaeota archaeon]
MPAESVTVEQCATHCNDCKSVCEQTLAYCLDKGGKHVGSEHINLLLDCINICDTCASACDRKSANHMVTCKACAEICRKCADSCASFEGDKQMQRCAEACRTCADSCRSMT